MNTNIHSLSFPALRKQWPNLAHTVQRERASTLNVEKIFELNQAIIHMQTRRFTTN